VRTGAVKHDYEAGLCAAVDLSTGRTTGSRQLRSSHVTRCAAVCGADITVGLTPVRYAAPGTDVKHLKAVTGVSATAKRVGETLWLTTNNVCMR
jgi:hypothetical protein